MIALATDKPIVLLIAIDDLRPSLGRDRDPIPIAPNIDRFSTTLHERGRQFDRAYGMQAVCGPSRTAFLTGRLPDERLAQPQPLSNTHPAGAAALVTVSRDFATYTRLEFSSRYVVKSKEAGTSSNSGLDVETSDKGNPDPTSARQRRCSPQRRTGHEAEFPQTGGTKKEESQLVMVEDSYRRREPRAHASPQNDPRREHMDLVPRQTGTTPAKERRRLGLPRALRQA